MQLQKRQRQNVSLNVGVGPAEIRGCDFPLGYPIFNQRANR